MIVTMKKIIILCLRRDKDLTIESLGDLGVLHVVNLQAPRGERLERVRETPERDSSVDKSGNGQSGRDQLCRAHGTAGGVGQVPKRYAFLREGL